MDPITSDAKSDSTQAEAPSSESQQRSPVAPDDSSKTPSAVGEDKSASVAPFTLSDQPTDRDKLGFKPYVQAIADFLMNDGTEPPLTLSVEGRWGSGKSSFMKQLKAEVQARGANVVWFNAWRYDKEDSMLAAFAVALTSDLSGEQSFIARLKAYTKLQKERFGWRSFAIDVLARLLVVFFILSVVYCLLRFGHIDFARVFEKDAILPLGLGLGLPGAFLLGIAALRKLHKITGNPLKLDLKKFANNPRYEERIPAIDRLHEDFERIVKCYARGKKLFVFIDDLDRCDVPKSAELMQALNLLLSDSLKVVYVIGLDRQKVAAGLAAKFKDLIPFLSQASVPLPVASDKNDALEFGFDYLEKFIQLPYHVPEPSAQGIQTFLHSLNGKEPPSEGNQRPRDYELLIVELKSDGEVVNSVATMVAPVFENNPRRIKQFINMFRLRALLAGRTGLLSKDPGPSQMTLQQLAKLVAIELRWPALLRDAERSPKLLENLQRIVWTGSTDVDTDRLSQGVKRASSPSEAYWAGKPDLISLLAAGAQEVSGDPLSSGNKDVARYGLHRVDLGYFLRVSPIVEPRPSTRAASPSTGTASASESVHTDEESEFREGSTAVLSDSRSSSPDGGETIRGRTVGPDGANPAQYAGWSDRKSNDDGPKVA